MNRFIVIMLVLFAATAVSCVDTAAETVDAVPSPTLNAGDVGVAVTPLATLPPFPTVTPPPTVTPGTLPTAPVDISPTPFIYSVIAGDNLEAIAQRHGVATAEIVALNPGLDPALLLVGQELVMPAAAAPEVPVLDETVASGVTPGQTGVYETTSGRWVIGTIGNGSGGAVENVQVSVELLTAEQAVVAQETVWIPGNVIPVGASAPFAVLFEEVVDGATARATVTGSNPVPQPGQRHLDLAVTEAAVAAQGAHYLVTGTLQNNGSDGAEEIVVVATLYDEEGNVTGYQQQVLDVTLPPGAALAVQMRAVPPGGEATRVEIMAHGRRIQS